MNDVNPSPVLDVDDGTRVVCQEFREPSPFRWNWVRLQDGRPTHQQAFAVRDPYPQVTICVDDEDSEVEVFR